MGFLPSFSLHLAFKFPTRSGGATLSKVPGGSFLPTSGKNPFTGNKSSCQKRNSHPAISRTRYLQRAEKERLVLKPTEGLLVSVCVWSSLSVDWASTGYGCHSCSWLAEQGKRNSPCPRSRLRIWSRELGSAVPSRASPLILHTQAESGAYLRDYIAPSRFPLRLTLESSCAIGLVPSLSGHAIALPMAFATENRHRAISFQGSSINGGPIQVIPWTIR